MIIFTLLFKRLVRKVANVLYATLIRAHVQEEIELFLQNKSARICARLQLLYNLSYFLLLLSMISRKYKILIKIFMKST